MAIGAIISLSASVLEEEGADSGSSGFLGCVLKGALLVRTVRVKAAQRLVHIV